MWCVGVGVGVCLCLGETGTIESSFGTSGKFRVNIPGEAHGMYVLGEQNGG